MGFDSAFKELKNDTLLTAYHWAVRYSVNITLRIYWQR